MSVIKAKRTASPFQVLQTATDLRKELTTYVMRDFAIDGKLTNMDMLFYSLYGKERKGTNGK